MEIQEVASELYGLPPEEFTAARNARSRAAKAGGDTDLAATVQALTKPTVGAWLLNQLVRQHPGEVERVLDLGGRLRAAQGTLGASELRVLGEQRRKLTSTVAQQAADIGREKGRNVSAQVIAEVEETLRSAMVDADAGAALATGLLVDTFRATGLEPVDLSRVVAVEPAGGAVSSGPSRARGKSERGSAAQQRIERALDDARRAVEEAEAAARAAQEESETARRRAVKASRRRADLQAELDDVRRRLADLEQRVAEATDGEEQERRRQIAVAREERSSVRAAAQARRELDRLLGDPGG